MNNPFKEIDMAEAVADIIIKKKEHSEYMHFLKYGPGRIKDLELNLEKIYET